MRVDIANGQDPGSRWLVPSRTSPELAAPVNFEAIIQPLPVAAPGCQSAQRARRNGRLPRAAGRSRSGGSANRRAPPPPKTGIRVYIRGFSNHHELRHLGNIRIRLFFAILVHEKWKRYANECFAHFFHDPLPIDLVKKNPQTRH